MVVLPRMRAHDAGSCRLPDRACFGPAISAQAEGGCNALVVPGSGVDGRLKFVGKRRKLTSGHHHLLGIRRHFAPMNPTAFFSFPHPNPSIRRELVELLYTSLPQVMAISATSVCGAVALAVLDGDIGYAVNLLPDLRYCGGAALQPVPLHIANHASVRQGRHPMGAGVWHLRGGFLHRARPALVPCAAAGGTHPARGSHSGCPCRSVSAWCRVRRFVRGSCCWRRPCCWLRRRSRGLLRPELPYKLGAVMLVLFWITLREASRHLSTAFIDRLEAKHALARQAPSRFPDGIAEPRRIPVRRC